MIGAATSFVNFEKYNCQIWKEQLSKSYKTEMAKRNADEVLSNSWKLC